MCESNRVKGEERGRGGEEESETRGEERESSRS